MEALLSADAPEFPRLKTLRFALGDYGGSFKGIYRAIGLGVWGLEFKDWVLGTRASIV